MDVTTKAGLMAQPRHRQDLYDEPTGEAEFEDLFDKLQFGHGSSLSLDNLVAPSNELTVGMEKYQGQPSEDSERDTSQHSSVPKIVRQDNEQDCQVEEASHLLSDRGAKMKASDKRNGNSEDVEQIDQIVQQELSIEEVEEQIQLSQVEHDLGELQHLLTDHQPVVVEQQRVHLQQRQQKDALPNGTKGIRKQNGQHAGPLIESESADQAESIVDIDKRQAKPYAQIRQMTSAESAEHPDTVKVEQGLSESVLTEEAGPPADKKTSVKSVSPAQRQDNANVAVEKVTDSLGFAGSAAMNAATSSASSVKLSAQGKTLTALSGVGLAKAKTTTKQSTAAQDLNRAKAPTRELELPEDVDKLSIVRQVSDEMKLRFGKNQHVEINLNPMELGRVRIQLQMQSDNSVNLKVSAEHAVIADLLNMNLNQLRKDLLAQGVQVNQVEVNADAHGQGGQDRQNQDDSSDGQFADNPDAQETSRDERQQFSVQA